MRESRSALLDSVSSNTRLLLLLISLHGLGACVPPRSQQSSGSPTSKLTNKVWVVSEPTSRAPGSFYIFLDDGTLVMTSCVETYRLATWRSEADGNLVVTEDETTSYRVRILELRERDLRLRLELVNEAVELKLQAAEAPFVCPDWRR